MNENIRKCTKQMIKAQKTLEQIAYVCRGTKDIDVLALKLSIVRAERHLAAAKAVLNEKANPGGKIGGIERGDE